MTFEQWFQKACPEIPVKGALAVERLLNEEATIPFIARYRKEQTGNLSDVQIFEISKALDYYQTATKRQQFIIGEIEKQNALTDTLKNSILTTFDTELLEELYLPFKKKRKNKASIAKEAGLEPFANWIWEVGHGTVPSSQPIDTEAEKYLSQEKGIANKEAAIEGARDILVERLVQNPDLHEEVRKGFFDEGGLKTTKGAKVKPNSKYERFFDYSESIQSLLKQQNSHRYMAIRRGWIEEELKIEFGVLPNEPDFDLRLLSNYEKAACTATEGEVVPILKEAAKIAYRNYILPTLFTELHRALRSVADDMAINVFSQNLRKLLLASPLGPKAVMGVDPGIRTGNKVAVVDSAGKYIGSTVIQLNTEDEKSLAKKLICEIIKQAQIQAIAVGNGTHGRETERFIRQTLKENSISVPIVMVNESGASIYSTSEVAREEFPDLDPTIRSAISIARRLQDPLAELVKLDPKSIGVGQYQHDVAPHRLKKELDFVVDSCVNSVGVNLNTASYHLLAHISGIGEALAKNVIQYRTEKGLIKSRSALQEIPRFSEKSFNLAAGFLRIPESDNPLDHTGIHPENYAAIESAAQATQINLKDLIGSGAQQVRQMTDLKEKVGPYTFNDICSELEKPGRDPRENFEPFNFKEEISTLEDLKVDMLCPGIVTNVTQFGAFVDIGVHQDGLVHLSQLSNRFIRDPREVIMPGDRVEVRVLSVDLNKKQIALTMKKPEVKRAPTPRPANKTPSQPRQQQQQARPPQQMRENRPPRPKRSSFSHQPFAGLAALKEQLKNK